MQKYAHLVELEKCCQTHIFLRNFVLIQPRTSPPKICKILQKIANFANLLVADLFLRDAGRQSTEGDRICLRCDGPGHDLLFRHADLPPDVDHEEHEGEGEDQVRGHRGPRREK